MQNATPRQRFRYSYEEFADHLRAMKLVREWEYTSRFGHLGSVQSKRANIARVVEYFSDIYPDQAEAIHKAERFLSICDYVARNETAFTRQGMVEKDQDGSFAVEPALLRSVHHLFTSTGATPSLEPKKVLCLAKAFKTLETEL
jgi:hypothetical protein